MPNYKFLTFVLFLEKIINFSILRYFYCYLQNLMHRSFINLFLYGFIRFSAKHSGLQLL